MKSPLLLLSVIAAEIVLAPPAPAQQPSPRPPIGVPADAKQFNGKWYRVYLEKGGWRHARERCSVGGRLVVIPDAPTQEFVKQLAGGIPLWIGATDEKLKGIWEWVDGSRAAYTAWEPRQPNGARKEDYMAIWHGMWNDAFENEPKVVGFVCEWAGK